MPNNELTTIEGVLEHIVYASDETHYTVARFQESGKLTHVTIVGSLPGVHAGQTMRLTGKWVSHDRFGEQFQVEQFEEVAPSTALGVERYLASGLIPGIGPVLASRMVKKFGEQTLDVMDNEPERLRSVPGIGRKKLTQIISSWKEQRSIRDVMVFLQGHGVGGAHGARIFAEYGEDAISIVKNNPYRLAVDIHGIGFKTADRIAQSIGIEPDSQIRAEAAILHVLTQITDEGHCYLPQPRLIELTRQTLEIENTTIIERALLAQRSEGNVVIEADEEERVYLRPLYMAEVDVASRLREIAFTSNPLADKLDVSTAVTRAEKDLGIKLSDEQRNAVASTVEGKLSVITGGPGVGKTTVINAVVKLFEAEGFCVVLAAPTGRAAKRLAEATGREAKTIHRLLRYNPRDRRFEHDEYNPLETHVVIVDEASMIDVMLLDYLVRAIPPEASLLLVGDVDQLPSVGPGCVLKDIITSGTAKLSRLTEVFRQKEESLIIDNAHQVNRGDLPALRSPEDGELHDFYFVERHNAGGILQAIKALCSQRIPDRFDLHPVRDIQVISPMHKGLAGVMNLNVELQECMNPGRPGIQRGGYSFCVSDKVMQIKNNYDKDVFNGDIGWIQQIADNGKEIVVCFDEREIKYTTKDMNELVLAYAISVHKSQGSEYPAVVIAMTTEHFPLLQRNLLYTAIARGKKLVVIVGTKKAIEIAVNNDRVRRRNSALAQRLSAVAGTSL